MYSIEFSKQARRALTEMPRNTARTISGKILALAEDPHAPGNNVKRLAGCQEYRLRVGDWRVIYALHDAVLVIEVIKIKPRGEAYR
ncbi:MAG: type II toxin-antitoxin system RelE/ParE family toxin [Thermodesulfobacteriota bacterium]